MNKQSYFEVRGGNPINGLIRPAGNKNEALPVLAASLLCSEPIILKNVPEIGDVLRLVEIMRSIGAEISWQTTHTLEINSRNVNVFAPPEELSRKIRGSFLLASPLLYRCKRATLPNPGGDRIGRRRLDTHLLALEQLGCEIKTGKLYEMELKNGFKGCEIFLDEPSVMGTENTIMAAVIAKGQTIIMNAACEPHVQNLCRFLNSVGARISGIGTNTLIIDGVEGLSGGTHRISPDHIEIGSFAALAAITGGELNIEPVVPEDLRMIKYGFSKLGIQMEINNNVLKIPAGQKLKIASDLHGAIPQIYDGPWPAFPADLTSIALVAAIHSEGVILIHEKMFESRLFFVDNLVSMGGKIILCDPHRAVVQGATKLQGAVMTSPDIRAGMALLIAALAADGKSIIQNVHQIDRGYEKIDLRLKALGADIMRKELIN